MSFIQSIKQLSQKELFMYLISLSILTGVSIFYQVDLLSYLASSLGVTALLFLAKGQPLGQLLTLIFSILYAYISYLNRYYGDMITYMGMTFPSALFAWIIWLKNPHKVDEPTVKINHPSKVKLTVIFAISLFVTMAFYPILDMLNTQNLLLSTVSIFTSMLASSFMIFRLHYYVIAYTLNDIVLIFLWVLISFDYVNYLPMVICFVIFFFYDLYAYFNWKKMKSLQSL